MAFVDILSMILCRLVTVISVSSLFVSANSSRRLKNNKILIWIFCKLFKPSVKKESPHEKADCQAG
jgi:hypothetical protein